MELQEALDFEVVFGKYCGKSIRTIAEDDEGLLYLDYIRGQQWIRRWGNLKQAIDEVFKHEPYKSDLDQAVDNS